MTGNVDPIVVYKISISGSKTMCLVKSVAYDDNSIHIVKEKSCKTLILQDLLLLDLILSLRFRGERGIRTPGTDYSVRQFSKLLVSATHPSLRKGAESRTKVVLSLLISKSKSSCRTKIITCSHRPACRCSPALRYLPEYYGAYNSP